MRQQRKEQFLKLAVAFAAIVVLGGCLPGGGGGGGTGASSVNTGSPTSAALTGTVADGYIGGATVFLDKNNNGVFDAALDEPAARTNADGTFSIANAQPGDVGNYRLIAIVSENATDADIGGAVVKPYYLTFPKGGPQEPFISPLSTLVDMRMRSSTMTKDEAVTAVIRQLNLTLPENVTTDDMLSADFVKISQLPTSDAYLTGQKLVRISRVLVNGMSKAFAAAKTTMGINTQQGEQARREYELFRLVMANVLDNLDSVVAQAVLLDTSQVRSAVQADVNASGDVLQGVFLGSNLISQDMILAQVGEAMTPSSTTKSVKDALEAGVYALSGNAGAQYDLYGLFSANVSGTSRAQLTRYRDDSGIAVSGFEMLSSNASNATWLTVDILFDSPFVDGASLTFSGAEGELSVANGPKFKLKLAKYDLAGKSMSYVVLKDGISVANGFSIGSTFPANSEAYELSFIAEEDLYLLPPVPKPGQLSIEALLAAYGTGSGSYLELGGVRMQFSPGVTSGAIKLFDVSSLAAVTPDALWQRSSLRGKDMLRLTALPEQYFPEMFEPFVSFDNANQASVGIRYLKGSVFKLPGYLFNKTAINAIGGGVATVP